MFCTNCGNQLGEQAAFCVGCGVVAGNGNKFCHHCGGSVDGAAAVCLKCGVALGGATRTLPGQALKSKVVAGILGILLGGLGIHRFYLGYNTIGLIQLALTMVSVPLVFCGPGIFIGGGIWLWGLIEGILIFTGQISKDAKGHALAD